MVGKATSSSKVALNSLIYTCSGLLLKCFSLFLLPLYTSYLTTTDYGITNIANSFINTMSFIVALSLYSAVMRFYVDLKDDKKKIKRFYGSIVVFVFLTCFLFGVLSFFFREFLSKYIFAGMNFFPIIFVCLISLMFTCQHTIYDNILRSQQRALKSSVLSILYFFSSVLLNIIFVVGFKMGALGVLLANAISTGLYTLYFIVDMVRTREIAFCLEWGLLKSALKYSIPILPHNLSTAITAFVSTLLIGNTHTMAALGVYAVATQFGNMGDTIQVYVNNAYGPWLYEKLHTREAGYRESLRKVVNVLSIIIGLFFVGIALFAHDYIVFFVDEAYVDAWKYVALLIMVFAIKIPYYFYVNVLFYYKKASKLLFVATLTSSFVNMFISFILIPVFGVYGSILADAIAMFIRVIIVYIISRHTEDIGLRFFDFVKNVIFIALFISVGLFFTYTKYSNVFSVWDFLYRVSIVLIYVLIGFVGYRDMILKMLKRAISRRTKRHVNCKKD